MEREDNPLTATLPVVYTALSKRNFFCRDTVSEYVLRHDAVPLNPFRLFDYFLGDRTDRDTVRRANNNCVRIADAVWVFGEVSDGVFHEISYAMSLSTPVRYFLLDSYASGIREIPPHAVEMEPDVPDSVGVTSAAARAVISAAGI